MNLTLWIYLNLSPSLVYDLPVQIFTISHLNLWTWWSVTHLHQPNPSSPKQRTHFSEILLSIGLRRTWVSKDRPLFSEGHGGWHMGRLQICSSFSDFLTNPALLPQIKKSGGNFPRECWHSQWLTSKHIETHPFPHVRIRPSATVPLTLWPQLSWPFLFYEFLIPIPNPFT